MKTKIGVQQVKKLLPIRKSQSNKSDGGRSLIIAGQKGMWGAAVLAATACSRAGSGYVILKTDKNFPSVKHPDFLTTDFKSKISKAKPTAVAVGPGLGVSSQTKKILKELYADGFEKVVIDADAINALAKEKKIFVKPTWILTPHEGELSRLLKVPSAAIRKNREHFAKLAAKKFGCIVVLKGHHTLAATKQKLYEIQTGNASLAKAGTGDVLTGIITAFLAQGLSPLDATLLGVTLHGFLADQWLQEKNDHLSLMAGDLVAHLPKAIYKLRK
jgi:NAD(P)H-hydrate epimerase